MMSFISKAASFVQRDFYIAVSYKLQFLFYLSSGFFYVATFYFVSELIDPNAAPGALDRYQSDYFSFVLIGLAATGFLQTGLAGFAEKLRTAMTEGSLEMMFASPARPSWILVMPCLWSFCFEGARALVMVLLGVLVFGADLSRSNLPVCGAVVLLTLTAYSVFGLLSAGIIMIVKRGDPLNWAFAQLSAMVAGAYFPIEVLPNWLEWIARLLPMTYSYHGMRMALLAGAGLAEVKTDLLVLGLFSIVGLPLATFVCNRAVVRAKRDGSLGTF